MSDKKTLLLAAIAATALPVSVYIAVLSYHQRNNALDQFHSLQTQQQQMKALNKRLLKYQAYQERVHQFLLVSSGAGVSIAKWAYQRFDIEDRQVNYDDLSRYVREANHGKDYYFIPENLDLNTLKKSSGTHNSASLFQHYDPSKPALRLTLKGKLLVREP